MKEQDKYKWKKKNFIYMCKYVYKEVSGPQEIQKKRLQEKITKRKAIREQA